jgi:hypothetical protein
VQQVADDTFTDATGESAMTQLDDVWWACIRASTLTVFVVVSGGAQTADPAALAPVPMSVAALAPPADPADSGFAEWRHAQLPRHDKTPAAWTMRAGDWDFLIATPRAMDAMDKSRIIDTTLANCRRPLGISAADSARVASGRPWAAFDSLMEDRPVFVISIMPVLRNFTECGWKNLGRPAMIRRGIRFVTEFEYDASRDPVSAVLVSRLRIARTVLLARAPVVVVSGDGAAGHATDQLRLYIPFDAIAPGITGDIPPTELMVWNKAGGEPDHIPLPNDILHAMWWDYLRWRAQRLAVRDRATAAAPIAARRQIVPLPEPSDTALRTSRRLQLEGRDADASKVTLERLADEKLSTDDRRIALMSLASTFQVDDDPVAAAFVASELTAMDPCALSGSSLSSKTPMGNEQYTTLRATGAMLDHTRPGVRCTSAPLGATFLHGLMFPGGGQSATWSRLVGLSITTVTVAAAVRAYLYQRSSKRWYTRYQTTLKLGVGPYFDYAVNAQNEARSLARLSGELWLASAIEAELQERIRASGLAAEHDFWLRPIVTPASAPGGSTVGMAGGITFRFR